MGAFTAICMLVALAYIFWNLVVFVFFKKKRRRALKFLGFGLIALIISGFGLTYFGDIDAVNNGFENNADQRAAKDAGFVDAEKWLAARTSIEAENLRIQLLAEAQQEETRAQEILDLAQKEDEEKRQIELAVKVELEIAEAEEQGRLDALAAELAVCKADLSCWGEKPGLAGTIDCAARVERLANYDFEWTDGLLGAKFTHYRWSDKDAGIVSLIGDSIKFQNGFGAWQYHVYSCDIDPQTMIVYEVRAEPGRL